MSATTVFWLSLALGACFGGGMYGGYRYAIATRELDALMAQSLAQLDLTPEDEAPHRRSDPQPFCACLAEDPWSRHAMKVSEDKTGDWSADLWWGKNS